MPNFSEKDLRGKSEQTLISNRKSSEDKRPFLVRGGISEQTLLRYYNESDVITMRGLGYEVEPTVDSNKKIKSVNLIFNSKVACEICEDMAPDDGEERVIKKATQRVEYIDGEVRMFCGDHFERKETKTTSYTDWINDH